MFLESHLEVDGKLLKFMKGSLPHIQSAYQIRNTRYRGHFRLLQNFYNQQKAAWKSPAEEVDIFSALLVHFVPVIEYWSFEKSLEHTLHTRQTIFQKNAIDADNMAVVNRQQTFRQTLAGKV